MKNKINKINYYGKEISFYLPNEKDHIQSVIRNTNTFYEIEMLKDVLKFIPTEGVAVDVGANIGNHTLFFSSICNLKTFAFEPSNKIRKILKKNVEINNLNDDVKVLPFALGDTNEEARLIYPNDCNDGMARVEKGADKGETIQIKTLDDYKLDKVVLLKIDVEGMELNVIKGAIKTIKRNRPVVFVELQTVEEYNAFRSFLYAEEYIAIEIYNATPTVMFWPKEKIMDYLPFFLSKGNF